MAFLASLLKTMRKKKTKGPWTTEEEEKEGEKNHRNPPVNTVLQGKWGAHLDTVEASEQVVEDDHVAVDGEQRQKTCD